MSGPVVWHPLPPSWWRSCCIQLFFMPARPCIPVFAGFSAESLRGRIEDGRCRFLITADEGKRGGKAIPLKRIADDAIAGLDVAQVLVYRYVSCSACPLSPVLSLPVPLSSALNRLRCREVDFVACSYYPRSLGLTMRVVCCFASGPLEFSSPSPFRPFGSGTRVGRCP